MSHLHVLLLTLLSVLLIGCQTCNSTVQIPGYYDSVQSLYTHDSNSLHIDPYALPQSESIDAFVETDVLMKEKEDNVECSNNVNDINTSTDNIKEMYDTSADDTNRKVEREHKYENNMQKELNDIHRRDEADFEKWNRWKRRLLHAERDRERRTKQDLQKKAKSGSKEWYVPSTDLLQPYKIAHRAMTRTQKLLSDSLNVYEYLTDLLQSARTLRAECEKMFVESSFQTFTEKKLSLRDDNGVEISGSTGNKVSAAGVTDNDSSIINDKDDNTNDEHNGESDSDVSVYRSGDVSNDDDNGKLRFIGELHEWYEHALMNSFAKQYNTSRLQWKVSSILFFPLWMYKTLASYLYDATHVLPDSFVAYSTVLQAAKREGHLLSTSLELIKHRLPELEAQREARLERERKEIMNEEESEDRNSAINKTDDDKNNNESSNSASNTQSKNVSKKEDYKGNGKRASENKLKNANTELINATPIKYEVATKPVMKEISKELEQTHHKVNAIGLLHYELWHLSRSHMTHMKETASSLENQIQEAVISNDESTTAKRKELKVLVKLRSRLHTWNEQMQYFSQKSKEKEASIAKAKTESLQSLMFGESFAKKWSWFILLIRRIGRYLTKEHFFDKQNKSDNTNVWLDSSEAEMALAMIARYRLGTETNWEFLDKTPSPHWLTVLTGLLPIEFTAIYTAPFATTLCLSVILVALLAYVKSKIIHSIAVTILTCQKNLYEDRRRARKTNDTKCTSTNMTTTTTVPASTHTSTNKEDNTHQTGPVSSHHDNEDGDNKNSNEENNDGQIHNECANNLSEITSVSPHTSGITPEQALRKRRKWMRVVKVLTIVQQFTPVLLFLCLSYMSAVQQIYSTMVFFALVLPTQRALNICVISAACLFLGCTAMKFNEYLINKYTQATRKMFDEQKKNN